MSNEQPSVESPFRMIKEYLPVEIFFKEGVKPESNYGMRLDDVGIVADNSKKLGVQIAIKTGSLRGSSVWISIEEFKKNFAPL